MAKYKVTVSSMLAVYSVIEDAPSAEDAIRQARAKAASDMKHWNYTASAYHGRQQEKE